MNKLFKKILGATLGISMAIGVGVAFGANRETVPVNATPSADTTIGFESSEGFTATTGYQSTVTQGPTGKQWEIFYGTTSTSSAITGSQSLAMRLYTTANYGYAKTKYKLENVVSVSFNIKAATTNSAQIKVNMQYSSDDSKWTCLKQTSGSGTDYSAVQPGTSASNVTLYMPTEVSGNNKVYLKWSIDSSSTKPSKSNAQLTIDDVTVTREASIPTTSVDVSPASVTLAPGGTQQLTTTVLPANTTDTLTYSSSATGVATVTSSGLITAVADGTATITATSGDYSDTCVVTVEAPTTPFITPDKTSTSGYTGMDETISVTYGNLTSELAVSSNNTSVVDASIDYDDEDGNADILLEFNGAGSTTVSLKDGSTQLATISVSVTASSVSITGMPASRSLANGANLDLGALITVTPTGSCSSDVTWSTDNSSIAGVTQAGVVTGAGVGSTTITVTPDDYPAGAVSCTVTVANVLNAVFGTTGSSSSTEVTDGSKYKTDYSYTIDTNITLSVISKVYPQTSNALKFGSSSAVGSMTFSIPSTIDSKPVYITSVTVRAVRYSETKGTTMLIGGVEKALTYSADDYTADLSSGEVTSFVLTADSSSSDKRMYVQSVSIQYAFKKTLNSIALSGSYQTTFTKGSTFNHDGLVVTATYSDSSTADVTSSATFSGYDLSNVGNQTVTVSYTEGTTKTATYSITVSYAAVTSVTLSQNSAEIGLNETFDYTLVTVTVSPNNANKEVTWSVSASTVGTDYAFDESGLLSGDTEGTITLKCESVADSSKYAELVVTVTGDPTAEFTPASVSGYVGKSDDIAFTYGNMSDTSLISITSSNSSIAEVDEFVADEGEGLVTVNFVAAGSATLSISYDGGSTLDSITVTVSTDSVTALAWSAPTIKVYSGATTTVSDASSWNVHYTMASGDYGSLVYGEYTLKLGGSSITLPHTWDASEDGKVLSIEYGGFASPTTSIVDVTQSLQAVNKPNEGDSYYQLVSTDADLEAGRYLIVSIEDAKAFDGSLDTLDAGQNNFDVTISDGTVIANDLTASGKYFDLTVENNAWTITSASGANVGHSATGNGMNGTGTNTITVSNGISTILGTGGKGLAYNSASGSSSERFRYYTSPAANANHSVSLFKLVTEEGEGSTNIANVAGHEAAQKAVVKFAKAFNAAMDTTAKCTTNMSSAWSTASSAWTTFLSEAAALGSAEETYAKNLIKYASSQWTDDTDEDYSYCLERAMKTYEVCVNTHGMEEFMSAVRPLEAARTISVININNNPNIPIIIAVISVITLTAIGGYYYLKHQKGKKEKDI